MRIVAEATVRASASPSSKKRRPSKQPGDIVYVYEQCRRGGHQRVRIGKDRWISRVTAGGAVLAEPVVAEERGQLREPGTGQQVQVCSHLLLHL